MFKILTVSILFSFFSFAQTAKISLDAHLHYFPEHDGFLGIAEPPCEDVWAEVIESDGEMFRYKAIDCSQQSIDEMDMLSYKDFIKDDQVQTALLISPSFDIRKESKTGNHEGHNHGPKNVHWNKNENLITPFDQRTSELTQKHPGKFIGICGLNYSWEKDDAVKRVSDCLNLPGMKGLKIHFYANENKELLRQSNAQEVVEETFKVISKNNPVILWHIDTEVPEGEFNEIKYVFSLAKKYPNMNFVLAHSMSEPQKVDYLLGLEKKHGAKLKNLYLETSAADHDEMMDAWKRFGLERVLFGSDNFNYNNNAINKFKKAFSKDEVNLIGNLNPESLLRKIGRNEVDNSDRTITNKVEDTFLPVKTNKTKGLEVNLN
ncbi:MAG: hypothetical protein CME64_16090 [Halobacteriovoraceae bacterium]|nr:hypothetical protein [Halobacteriovoraceae bacterium]|tara:strand:- start:29515 stop:30642 length:1128 start_codon:yes stop_codon:yes gene_type:complete